MVLRDYLLQLSCFINEDSKALNVVGKLVQGLSAWITDSGFLGV